MKKTLEHLCGIIAAAGMVWALALEDPSFGTFAAGAALFLAGILGFRLLSGTAIDKQPKIR